MTVLHTKIEEQKTQRQWIITNLDTLRSSVVVSGRNLYDKVVAEILKDLQALAAERDKNRWIPVEERMPTEEKVYWVLDAVRDTKGVSLFQKPANRNPWRSTKALGEMRTITHWQEIGSEAL